MAFDRRTIPASARESLWHAADGSAIRRLDWGEPGGNPAGVRGSILFMPGRGDAYEKYLETCEHWRRQGWRVTAADWRGQAGSGRLGSDGTTGHIDSFDRWIGDLGEFWRAWAAERDGPRVLAGHSMGGHLVLRAAGDHALAPEPDAIVLSAPMLSFLPERVPAALKRALAAVMTRLGDPRRPAWRVSEKPGVSAAARPALLTHDEARYADEAWWKRARPELAMGPGSWGWIAAAQASMRRMEAAGYLEAVRIPVFITATTADRLVGWRAIERAASRLPDCTLQMLGAEARHEIFRECDPVRLRALAAVDAFLDRIAPA